MEKRLSHICLLGPPFCWHQPCHRQMDQMPERVDLRHWPIISCIILHAIYIRAYFLPTDCISLTSNAWLYWNLRLKKLRLCSFGPSTRSLPSASEQPTPRLINLLQLDPPSWLDRRVCRHKALSRAKTWLLLDPNSHDDNREGNYTQK